MLAVVFVLLPSLVGFAFWHSNRQNRDNSYRPAGGQRRWTAADLESQDSRDSE
ncbi:MAG: hypothetical protein ACI8QC_001884 [Planctomycetota bacterium]|jgi:hypothetical protein